MPDKLSDLVVVITGASSGLGRGVALKLGSEGAKVVVAARRKPLLDTLVSEIEADGAEALAVEFDVSDPAQVAALAKAALDRFGRIDVWMNNVGVGALGYFWDIPIEDHARLVDVNLKGLIYGAHAALRQFRAQGYGTLLNIGSIDSETPLALQNTYAATKAAVLSLSRSLNQELRLAGEKNIKIGTVMPFAVDTPWWYHAANYTGHAPRVAMMDGPQKVIDAMVNACLNPGLEHPVGWKAKGDDFLHHLFPTMMERISAEISKSGAEKAVPQAPHTGAIYKPMDDGLVIGGGLRDRFKMEDELKAKCTQSHVGIEKTQ